MPKFRKKPVEIEAWQWPGDYPDGGLSLFNKLTDLGLVTDTAWTSTRGELPIKTLDGTMLAQRGDWIIRGVQGEFYPCKPDIFYATYDAQP